MQKKRAVMTVVLTVAIICLLVSLVLAVHGGVREEDRWLPQWAANAIYSLASTLIVLWIALRYMPAEKLLLDREEVQILRRAPWWFIGSVAGVLGLALWIGTWVNWWAAGRYPIP
jgi:magnesium-transporting ATPase (P-type)